MGRVWPDATRATPVACRVGQKAALKGSDSKRRRRAETMIPAMASVHASAHPAVTTSATRPAAERTGHGKALAVSALVWTAVCLFQSLAAYNDAARAGSAPDFLALLLDNSRLYVPWVVFSFALYSLLSRTRLALTRPAVFAASLAVASLGFMLPYEMYLVLLGVIDRGLPLSNYLAQLARHPMMFVFIDYVLFLGGFAFTYGLVVFQRTLRDERARQRMEAENLSLRLQVEQVRMAALKGQLEPHFLFNALNAISALVRGGAQANALSALQRLSELLRYAIAASDRDWTTLADEIAFVQDYISLQKIRYGESLQWHIHGVNDSLQKIDCPPLMIQPLVENALRHDLEAGGGISDIRMVLGGDDQTIEITISNPFHAGSGSNGGAGIGLRNTRSRLALVYGSRAELTTRVVDGRFVVELRIPRHANE
jgi:two-component system, LytTR family, sensor histidine kinase AlgZ